MENTKIRLNSLQLQWLFAHGGRTEKHVQFENNEPFVFMGQVGGTLARVFIPSEAGILEYFAS